jgi:hypothetical protein
MLWIKVGSFAVITHSGGLQQTLFLLFASFKARNVKTDWTQILVWGSEYLEFKSGGFGGF